MSKHTPGPWKADLNMCVVKSDKIFVAGVYNPGDNAHVKDAEREANAVLIAAAPELLDSLGRVTRISHLIHNHQHANLPILPEQWSELSEACTEAIAVIAKAGGA